jgi:hypothetical protein
MTGIYKITQKKNPKKFYLIGTVNIDQWWKDNGDDTITYSLLWKCSKSELDHYIKHFQERYKSTWGEKDVSEVEHSEVKKEIETASFDSPVTEKAVIKEQVKKPRGRGKK